MTWLAKTPTAVVRAHVLMLPRLRAGERLDRATIHWGDPEERRDHASRWEREAAGDRVSARPGVSLESLSRGDLAGMGIGERLRPAKRRTERKKVR